MKLLRSSTVAAATLAFFHTTSVFAQAAPGTDSPTSKGFPLGDKARLHTNLDLGIGYDTNPRRLGAAISDVVGVMRPGIDINVPGNRVEFDLNGELTIEQFFGTNGTSTNGATGQAKFGGDIGTSLKLGGDDAPIGFELFDSLARTPTFFPEYGRFAAQEIVYQQWVNNGLAQIVARPGGGALELRLGYTNHYEFYDNLANGQQHGAHFEGKLRFLPKTAAVLTADYGFFSPVNLSNGATATKKATPLDVEAGLQGQLTERLSIVLKAGFADLMIRKGGFTSELADDNQVTFVGRAGLNFMFARGGVASASIVRRALPIIAQDGYSENAIQARISYAMLERVTVGIFGELDLRKYALADQRVNIMMADARAEYWFFNFLSGSIGYQMIRQTPVGTTMSALFDDYTRHQVLLSLALRY